MIGISGILVIDKPAGWTSHDVVARLRGTLRQRYNAPGKQRVGHGGTLDPMATGVLPVFIGRATRAAEFCENAEKEYIAGILLGVVTDTQDITGTVLGSAAALCGGGVSVTADELSAVLPSFLGRQKQVPPMYSAIKQNGKKLYELARRGIEVDRPAREIEITAIEIVDAPPECDTQTPERIGGLPTSFYLRVACSKGTYIRTLVHDIGAALGCGAAMSYLRRTRAGVFTIGDAHTPDDVIFEKHVLAVDTVFSQYPAVTVSDADVKKAKNGALHRMGPVEPGKYRIYAPDGEFLLFGEIMDGKLDVIKSFYEA